MERPQCVSWLPKVMIPEELTSRWIVAIILGHMANCQIRQTGEHGRGPATAGLILGYIGIAPLICYPSLMMIGDLFDSPWKILIVPVVIILLIVLIFIRMYGGGSR